MKNRILLLYIIGLFVLIALISYIIDVGRCKPKTDYAKIIYNDRDIYVSIDKIKPLGFGYCYVYDTDGSEYRIAIDSIEYIQEFKR